MGKEKVKSNSQNVFNFGIALAVIASSMPAFAANGFGNLPIGGGIRTDQEIDVNSALRGIENSPAIRALLSRNKANSLRAQGAAIDSAVSTIKFKHYFQGLEVMGSQAFYHVAQGKTEVNDALARFDLNVTPKVSTEEAIALARSFSGNQSLRSAPSLKVLPSDNGSARLVYSVRLKGGVTQGGLEVQLDAHTGELVGESPDHLNIAPIHVYSAAQQGYKVAPKFGPDPTDPTKRVLLSCTVLEIATGETAKIDAPACENLVATACQSLALSGDPLNVNPDGCEQYVQNGSVLPGADDSVLRAAQNTKMALTYYLNTHNRNGFDNKGTGVKSVVHMGEAYSNAFWASDAQFMAYGDGDGKELGDFTNGVDVAGHEMTHGVVQNTANLGHTGEPASLNEAYADFFGKMIENKGNWLLGGELFIEASPTNGIRNLENPGALMGGYIKDGRPVEAPYPSKVSEMAPVSGACTAKNDFCWAHFNATVPGHASYLIHEALGRAKAERLYYVTLSQFLTERAKFKDAATATMKACSKLYTRSVCDQVQEIFEKVEML